MSEIKHLSLREFVDLGLLQEVNRMFFHPRGLALSVVVDDQLGTYHLSDIWDHRDDPEGIRFASLDPKTANEKARSVEALLKTEARQTTLGYVIQPLPPDETTP